MSNAEIIANVERWQNEPLVHTLRCRKAECRSKLVPAEIEGKVLLRCPACRRRHTIPQVVRNFKGLDDATRKFLGG